MSNRHSTGSRSSNKRWSMPSLQPLDTNMSNRTSITTQDSTEPPSPASSRARNRGSISGTGYGKTDFGVPTIPATSTQDRRASRRISRISKLSDVSEVESEKTRSRQMSESVMDDIKAHRASRRISGSVMDDLKARRASRRMSVADNLGEESERRRSRRVSLLSVNSGVNRFSVMSRANVDWRQDEGPAEPPKTWQENNKKASNWYLQKKMLNTGIACAVAFSYTFSMSIYSFAYQPTITLLGFTDELAIVPYAAFAFGLIFGPICATPFEKRYGRKVVLVTTIPFFAVLMIGAGISKSAAGLIVCRFLSAFFAAPGLFVSFAHVSDMWAASYLSLPVAVFTAAVLLGICGGPIIGGVILEYESWHWTMWIPLFTVVLLAFAAIGMSESHKDTLIKRNKSQAQRMQEEEEKQTSKRKGRRTRSEGVTFKGNMMFASSLAILFKMPALGLSSLYVAYTVAVLLVLPIVLPSRFASVYNFSSKGQGLMFAGLCLGVLIAVGFIYLLDMYVYQPRLDRWEDEHDPLNEKGDVEMAENEDGPYIHSSWRKGLAVSTRNLGIRDSNQTDATRNNSATSQNTHRTNRRASKESRRSRLQAFSEKNINIAIAASRFLNSNPANANRKIIVERVMVLLKNNDSFTDICAALVKLGLEFEEALLAKVMVNALEKEKGGKDMALSRSKSLHRYAAQAALMGDPEELDTVAPLASQESEEPAMSEQDAPPAEWRYMPALLSTFCFPGGLIMLAWTANNGSNYIIPAIGLGLTGFGAALTYFSATTYSFEINEETTDDAIRARAGTTMLTYLLATIFPLFVIPMYSALGFQIATTVFGGAGIALGLVPWIIFFGGAKLSGKKEVVVEDNSS